MGGLSRAATATAVVAVFTASLSSPANGEQGGAGAAAPPSSLVEVPTESAPLICHNPLYSQPAEAGPTTAEGHPISQDWLGNPTARARLTDLDRTVSNLTVVAGVIPDNQAQTMIVVVENGTGNASVDEVRTTIDKLDLPFDTDIRSSCRPTDNLAAIQSEISSLATTELSDASFSSFIDVAEGVVRVITNESAVEESLARRFGDQVRVDLVDGGLRLLAGDRNADYSPHYGDAKIWQPGWDPSQGEFCSSNFTYVSNVYGVRVQATAAHCTTAVGNVFVSGFNYYGDVAYRSTSQDLAGLYRATETYTNRIWTTPCCPSTRNVVGKVVPPVGDFVCVGGARTLAQCGIQVVNHGASYCSGGICASNLMQVCSTIYHADVGDSGGIVYQRSGSSNALAAGMILGGVGYYCGSVTYVQTIPQIESLLQATLLTSP